MRLGHASGFQATLPSRPCCLPSRDASVVTRSSPWGVDELWGHLGRARADAWESGLATASGLRVCSHVLSGRRHSEGAYRSEVRAAAEHRHVGQTRVRRPPCGHRLSHSLVPPLSVLHPWVQQSGRDGQSVTHLPPARMDTTRTSRLHPGDTPGVRCPESTARGYEGSKFDDLIY